MGLVKSTISEHLYNVFDTNELQKQATVRIFRTVQQEEATCKEILQVQIDVKREVSRKVKFYNLDAIISVGYRVNSSKATQFIIWATQTLKEYIIKGFVMDDNRLKQGQTKDINDSTQTTVKLVLKASRQEQVFIL